MKKRWIAGMSLLALLSLPLSAVEVEEGIPALYSKAGTSTVIISFKDRISALELDSLKSASEIKRALMKNLEDSSADLKKRFGLFSNTRIIEELWTSNAVVAEVSNQSLKELASRDDIEQITLDGLVPMMKPVANSSYSPKESEWTYGLKQMGVDKFRQAHNLTGEGVRVGILDTGIDAEHPDLKGKVIHWKSFRGKDGQNPSDWHGHGTHVAGTIAGGNASGKAIGVAPNAKLIIARIFGPRGMTSKSAILKAMKWMADPDGNPDTDDHAQIVSNSWGGKKQLKIMELSRWRAVKTWRKLNMVPVFAAGNSGPYDSTIGTPGGYPHSFAVGAVNSNDVVAKFSSRGPIKWGRKTYTKPDISAPGVSVFSAKPGGGYQKMSGTSMATPHISGLAALLLQANPDLNVDQVQDLLTTTAKDLGYPGKDEKYGHGRANILKAVESLKGLAQIKREQFKTIHAR